MTRNLLLSGGPGHEFDAVAQAIDALLRDDGIDTDIVDEPTTMLARLATGAPATGAPYDLLTVHALHWSMAAERYAHLRAAQAFTLRTQDAALIERFVAEGGGLLALHTAVICFDAEPSWHALCAASWNWDRSSHPPAGDVRVCTHRRRSDPPDHRRARRLRRRGRGLRIPRPGTGHQRPCSPATPTAIATRSSGHTRWAAGRVVVDTLGHDRSSLEHPTHRTILRRAATWALGTRVGTAVDTDHCDASPEPTIEEQP